MTAEQNKAIIRRYREIHTTGNLDQLDQIVAADLNAHSRIPGTPEGLAGGKVAHQMFLSAFPDVAVTTEDLVAEGDKVVERFHVKGTNTGSFMGAPPTGKAFETWGISIFRLANGKIVEHWGSQDLYSVMVQLGFVPAPGSR
jgi:predicted ester cyclase